MQDLSREGEDPSRLASASNHEGLHLVLKAIEAQILGQGGIPKVGIGDDLLKRFPNGNTEYDGRSVTKTLDVEINATRLTILY